MFLPRVKIPSVKRAVIFSPLPEWRYYSKRFEEAENLNWLNINFKLLKRGSLLAGPILSSPALALLVELLREKGVKEILFLGWAGKSPKASLEIGDLFIAKRAISLEGTSRFYFRKKKVFAAEKDFFRGITNQLREEHLGFISGTIVTVDAPQVVEGNLKEFKLTLMKAQALDMETSALYALAHYYKIKALALHFITDELGKLTTLRPEKKLTSLREALFNFFRKYLSNEI